MVCKIVCYKNEVLSFLLKMLELARIVHSDVVAGVITPFTVFSAHTDTDKTRTAGPQTQCERVQNRVLSMRVCVLYHL